MCRRRTGVGRGATSIFAFRDQLIELLLAHPSARRSSSTSGPCLTVRKETAAPLLVIVGRRDDVPFDLVRARFGLGGCGSGRASSASLRRGDPNPSAGICCPGWVAWGGGRRPPPTDFSAALSSPLSWARERAGSDAEASACARRVVVGAGRVSLRFARPAPPLLNRWSSGRPSTASRNASGSSTCGMWLDSSKSSHCAPGMRVWICSTMCGVASS